MMIDIEGNPIMELLGHEGAVNSLSQVTENELVSGSWDATAKIWDLETGKVKQTLTGHTHAVSVLAIKGGTVITGSQDKMIRIWHNGKMEKEIKAHDDIVRGFSSVPQMHGFASCSNDEVVKLWSLDGTNLLEYRGHSGFVFAIDTLESGEIVTGGDDCTVRVWDHGECK
jgi:phospholipase A-2-activating protein